MNYNKVSFMETKPCVWALLNILNLKENGSVGKYFF